MDTLTQNAAANCNDTLADNRRAQLAAVLERADPKLQERKESLFRDVYDLIVPAMARKVPQKTILVALKDTYGLKLHPARFRELLDAETERRLQAGETMRCTLCSHPIAPAKRVAVSDLLAGMSGHHNHDEVPHEHA